MKTYGYAGVVRLASAPDAAPTVAPEAGPDNSPASTNAGNGFISTDGAVTLFIDTSQTGPASAVASIAVWAWNSVLKAWVLQAVAAAVGSFPTARTVIPNWASSWCFVQVTALGTGATGVNVSVVSQVNP